MMKSFGLMLSRHNYHVLENAFISNVMHILKTHNPFELGALKDAVSDKC